MPNTLGLTTSTDASQERLLKGIMDDDAKLFKEEPLLFDLTKGDENEGSDEAAKELLEEIDRSLKGFEKAARTHAWLGDAGLHAEEMLIEKASQARDEGSKAENVDLARFVRDAILLDNGQIDGDIESDHFDVRIPSTWQHGLDELPGYDPTKRLIRLTTNLDVTSDADGNAVGYLGRAHPLVRRALDRVRNLSFGGMADKGQDSRASAAKADVKQPTLLYTFLGRVSSGGGRELERVLAVQIDASGQSQLFDSADEWSRLADPDKAIVTTDVWENHFESWGEEAAEQAKESAAVGFHPLADAFVTDRKQTLETERTNQEQWVTKRAEEITDTKGVPVHRQTTFIDDDDNAPQETVAAPDWASIADPAERLAAFGSDRRQSTVARSEADGVLRIYKQRIRLLDRLSDLGEPEIISLGVLMLVPEEDHGA